MHTATLVAALREVETMPAGAQILLIATGARIVAGAALYCMPAS